MKLFLMSALMFSMTIAFARADIVPKPILPLEARAVDVTVTKMPGDSKRQVEVRAKALFSNECLAPEETLRGMRSQKGGLAYTFYGEPLENRICTTQYLPVEKTFLIDRFDLREYQDLPEITVNGVKASVTFVESN